MGETNPKCIDGGGRENAARSEKNGAVEELFRQHNEALFLFLRSRLKSDQDAREIAQEAYVRLLQLDRPEELSFLRAYLFKIASNLAVDHVRRQGRFRQISKELPLFEFPTPPSQEGKLAAEDEIGLVKIAVAELPPKCRQAFLLSNIENWPSSRIAKHMNLSDRMVRNYVSRALEHIRRRLAST